MAGITSKAAGGIENKYKFNAATELESKELSDGSGLELYGIVFRNFDPQIGRFHSIDALSSMSTNESPFSFCANNPISFIDPLGLDTIKTIVSTPPNAQAGQVVNVPNSGEGTSSYIYDPSDRKCRCIRYGA